jgi:hypothetical protein
VLLVLLGAWRWWGCRSTTAAPPNATPWGQTMVVIGIVSVVACGVWAGRLLKLPEEQRVFYD